MNKFFPLLAFAAFAAFALVACSEDKPAPLHSKLCEKIPITKECLVSKWRLDSVKVRGYSNSGCGPTIGDNLKLEKNGKFTFTFNNTQEKLGLWELLEDGGMRITFEIGDNDDSINPIDAKIDIRSSEQLELIITTTGYSGFLQCSSQSPSATFTEVFVWQGEK